MRRLLKVTTGLLGTVLFAAVIGFGISTTKTMPDHAWILVDDAKRVYLSQPRLLTAREAYELKYKPDDDCRNSNGFVSEGRSLTGLFLQKIGLLRPVPERWNEGGTWNW
ncbi:MAG: hypothetical protein QOF24_2233 [Verrucomicrobiota bacterium]